MEKSKKSLGQNFLINKEKIKEIVEALDVKSGDIVVEIGPGHGELTKEIKNQISNIKIVAIEKDGDLAEKLRISMGAYGDSVEIVAGDVLKILPQVAVDWSRSATKYKLIGNIPEVTVLTVQKEVAKRICGGMNLLSASVRYWAEPEIIGIIPKSDFSPKPKVDSAIIRLITRKNGRETKDRAKESDNYYKFIKILFKQPRKTALNNLLGTKINKNELEKILEEAGIKPSARPQDLEMAQLEILAEKTASNVVY